MKKYLLGLLVGFVSLISFGYCSDIIYLDQVYSGSLHLNNNYWHKYYNINEDHQYDLVCYRNISSNCGRNNVWWNFVSDGDPGDFSNSVDNGLAGGGLGSCTTDGATWISTTRDSNCVLEVKAYNFSGFSQEACESEFDLIPSDSCPACTNYNLSLASLGGSTEYYPITGNVNVVVNDGIDYTLDDHNNALWLSVGLNTEIGGQCTGDGNWSALFINGIQHESASLIDINIADYVPWDYSINDDVFDLDVGSGYDQDYIDGVIDVQSYRPTSEDFTQTFVGGLILFTPYIVILLFVILVWNLIKKIFKTK